MITAPAVESKPMQVVTMQSHHCLNKQNQHIANCFDRANWVLIELMLMGLTVERLVLEGSRPEITVQSGPQCDQLNGHVFCVINQGSTDRCTKRAYFQGCMVQWEAREPQ